MTATTFAEAIRSSITTTDELRAYLRERGVDQPFSGLEAVGEPSVLPIRIPRYYLDLIDWANPDDPLRRQVLPLPEEQVILPDDLRDPIGDDAHSPVPGIVHRYPDRALLLLTATCAVHCRFCFRREFIGKPIRTLRSDQLDCAFRYLADHPEIWEVILSGGDPLVFPDAYLGRILGRLRSVPHVKVIRIHTRIPAIFPGRLTSELAALLRENAPVFVVVHVNHAREVTDEFASQISNLIDRGVPVLSQSVLLRGVNDDVASLTALFRRLVEARVKPYYLHQLDRAPGTNHFRVPLRDGIRLMRALRGNISGLCLPTYMLDIPGGHGKVPLQAEYVHDNDDGTFEVVNHRGVRFAYEEPVGDLS